MSEKKSWTREQLEKIAVGKMTTVAVPVNTSFEAGQRVLDLGEMEELLKKARLISQQECDCKQRMGNCDSPQDGCLSLDEEAEDMIKNYGAHEIFLEDALAALKRTHEAGLVHMAYTMNGQDKVGVVCSCCSCCCHSLSAALDFDYPGLVLRSELVARDAAQGCVDCGTCVSRCHFGARKMVDEKMVYTTEKCFGCGLCVTTCPKVVITMVPRPEEESS